MDEYIEREAAITKIYELIKVRQARKEWVSDARAEIRGLHAAMCGIAYMPAADLPPTLWTNKPILDTEFMTHSQGGNGYEIHFRTDSREKYEAVQDACRRQMGHAKPAADLIPSDGLTEGAKDLIRYMPDAVNMLAEKLMKNLTDVILYGSPETEAAK